MADYATASRTKDHYESQLLRDHSEIVSLSPRLKLDEKGAPTGDAVIVIGINPRKLPRLGQRRRDEGIAAIPTRLAVVGGEKLLPTGETVEVVVEERGEVVADALTTGVRPCPGGYSIGNARGTGGTLGGVVRLGDGSWCGLLGNNHVLAAMNFGAKGDRIYQPGPRDGGGVADTIGRLESWVSLKFDGTANEVDCAVARATVPCGESVTRHVYGIGVPAKVATATPSQFVRKCGKATEVTYGEVKSDNATVVVSYGTGLEARFVGQLEYSKMAGPGDSGSLIWDAGSLTVVGLHIASDSILGYGNDIQKVLAALGVSLV